MKRLLVVSIFILALPFLVSVNNYEPSQFAALAGRSQAGGGWCDVCSSPPGTCIREASDPECNMGLTIESNPIETTKRDKRDYSSGLLLLTLAALMIGRFIHLRAL